MSDKPKKNRCKQESFCEMERRNCVYFKKRGVGEGYGCLYDIAGACTSLVAQTNAMVLALQELGFDVTLTAKEEQK